MLCYALRCAVFCTISLGKWVACVYCACAILFSIMKISNMISSFSVHILLYKVVVCSQNILCFGRTSANYFIVNLIIIILLSTCSSRLLAHSFTCSFHLFAVCHSLSFRSFIWLKFPSLVNRSVVVGNVSASKIIKTNKNCDFYNMMSGCLKIEIPFFKNSKNV